MAVVERISHRVAVMYLGEIVEIGPRAGGLRRPAASLHQAADRRRAGPRSRPAHADPRPVANDEIKSPIRPVDYVPPQRTYRTVSEGHLVQEWDGDWKV